MIVRPLHRRRAVAAAAALTSAALLAVAGCSSDSSDSANTLAATPTASGATSAASVQAACTAELAINGLDFPGFDPDAPTPTAQELQAFAAKAEPLATTLRTNLPAELTSKVDVLVSVVNTAKQGKPIDYEGSGLIAAGQAVDAWMVDNCGYPKLALTNNAGTLTGLPASIAAGPVAITFTNAGDPAKAGFVLLFGKVKDGATATATGVAAGTADLDTTTDIITGIQPQGDKPGYTVAKLPAGHYIVASPLGTPPDFAGGTAAIELDVR